MHSNLCSACLLQWIAHFSRTGCSFFSSAWHCTHKTRRREGKDRMQPWAGVSVGGKMASSCSFPSLGFGSMLLAHLSPPIHAFVPYLLTTAPLSVMRLSLPNSSARNSQFHGILGVLFSPKEISHSQRRYTDVTQPVLTSQFNTQTCMLI